MIEKIFDFIDKYISVIAIVMIAAIIIIVLLFFPSCITVRQTITIHHADSGTVTEEKDEDTRSTEIETEIDARLK